MVCWVGVGVDFDVHVGFGVGFGFGLEEKGTAACPALGSRRFHTFLLGFGFSTKTGKTAIFFRAVSLGVSRH